MAWVGIAVNSANLVLQQQGGYQSSPKVHVQPPLSTCRCEYCNSNHAKNECPSCGAPAPKGTT